MKNLTLLLALSLGTLAYGSDASYSCEATHEIESPATVKNFSLSRTLEEVTIEIGDKILACGIDYNRADAFVGCVLWNNERAPNDSMPFLSNLHSDGPEPIFPDFTGSTISLGDKKLNLILWQKPSMYSVTCVKQ